MDYLELLNNTLEKKGFPTITEAITDEKKAQQYMIDVLKKYHFPFLTKLLEETFNESNVIRSIHSVLTFALGLVISDFMNLSEIINSYYKEKTEGYFQNDFIYIWAITSILHDIGYWESKNGVNETDINAIFNKKAESEQQLFFYFGDNVIKCENLKDNGFSAISHINKDISSNKSGFIFHNMNYKKENDFSFNRYKSETYLNYYKYKRDFLSKIIPDSEQYDHGIVGGVWAFNNLIHDKFSTSNESRDLYLLMDIAYKIMDHNIWKASSNLDSKYEDYSLNELLPCNFKKIDYKKEPLLFLLSLTDTLEFSKRIEDDSINGLVAMEVDRNKIIIENNSVILKKWIDSIEDLKEWVNVETKRVNDHIIISAKL